MSARAAATEVVTIWQLAENSTGLVKLSKGTASIVTGSAFVWCWQTNWNTNCLCWQVHLTLGWTAAAICFYMSIISPAHMASHQYVYNITDAANFAAFTPISWCLFVAWIIFVSYIGQAGMYGNLWGTFLKQKPTRCNISQLCIKKELYMFQTGLLSIIRSLNIVFIAIGICHTVMLTVC